MHHCTATVKRTGKVCGRKALDNGFCGYHRPAVPAREQAVYSFENPVPARDNAPFAPSAVAPSIVYNFKADDSLETPPPAAREQAVYSFENPASAPPSAAFQPAGAVEPMDVDFEADNSLETAIAPAGTRQWNMLPIARVEQALPFASRVLRRFNLADFRFIL